MKATQDSEAGVMPPEKLLAEASSKGFKVKCTGSKRTIIDGPFSSKDLIAGKDMDLGKKKGK